MTRKVLRGVIYCQGENKWNDYILHNGSRYYPKRYISMSIDYSKISIENAISPEEGVIEYRGVLYHKNLFKNIIGNKEWESRVYAGRDVGRKKKCLIM